MWELCPDYKVMLKLSRIVQLATFALNATIFIINQNIRIMSTFRHQINIKY